MCLLVGVGSAWADSFSTTYSYGLNGWSLTNYTDQSSYYLVPSGNDPSVATISGIFSDKTITSNVVVTINCGTYGSGTNPSASTFSLYKETACTNAITATQGGTLPTDKNYKNVTYTITQANAASLNGDLAIKITKPGKTIRLNSIKVEFSYTTSGAGTTPEPTKYNVTVANNIEGGTVTANPTSAAAGATITLTPTPDDGYEFASWNVKDASNNTIDVTNNKFTMPAANVNVSATFSPKAPVVDYATLPFNWTGGVKDDFLALSGVTSKGLGSDYAEGNAPYRIKLDDTGDYIQIKTNEAIGQCVINVKKIGGANNSSITVQESSNGTDFTDVQSLLIDGGANDTKELTTTVAFKSASRYVRFVFTKGSNVGVGAISILAASNATLESITLDGAYQTEFLEDDSFDHEGVTVSAIYSDKSTKDVTSKATFSNPDMTTPGDKVVTVTYTEGEITKTATYTITVQATPTYMLRITQPADGGVLIVKNEDGQLSDGTAVRVGTNLTCEVTDIPSGKRFSRFYITYDDNKSIYKATNPATFDNIPTEGITEAAISVTYQDKQLYTISYMVNGINTAPQVNVEEQTPLVFPTPTATNGKTFVGWVESTIDEPTDEKPSFVNPVGLKATANKTYYAVFATKDGEGDPNMLTSVSGTITSGEYYLVDTYNNNGTLEYWAAQGGVSSKKSIPAIRLEIVSLDANGILSFDISQIAEANKPSLYTINISENKVELKQGDNFIYATYGTNGVNADLSATTGDNTMDWNCIVGEEQRHQIKVVSGDKERILMLLDHTNQNNPAHYFKSYAETNSNTGGATNQMSYGSGNLYFLQAGVATYSGYTTAPYGTLTIPLNAACHDTDGKVYATYSNDEKAWVVPAELTVAEINIVDDALDVKSYATGAVVPANTGVMVSANEGGDYTVNVSTGGSSVFGNGNCLRPSGDNDITAEDMAAAAPNCEYFRLTMHEGTQIGFWWGAAEGAAFGLAANKAYLAVPKSAGIKVASMWIDGNTTSIDAIKDVHETYGVAYNLAGQRVNANAKGIVIINGKKVLKK